MKCKLILGEQQKDIEIPGEDIVSELRIQAVKLFDIDITEYQIFTNNKRLIGKHTDSSDGQTFELHHIDEHYEKVVKQLSQEATEYVKEKGEKIKNGELVNLFLEGVTKMASMLKTSVKATTQALREMDS